MILQALQDVIKCYISETQLKFPSKSQDLFKESRSR